MKTVSEKFIETQNELIRPALQMHFEVNTDVMKKVGLSSENTLGLDETVVPVNKNWACYNDHYYAILGDDMPVDDPNRICAPDNTGDIVTPNNTVPLGVSEYVSANTEFLLGDADDYYKNFVGLNCPITLSFKGYLIPRQITVEIYDEDSETWSTEEVIDNLDLNTEITFTPADYSEALKWRRFKLLNTTKGGRYIVNWLRRDESVGVYGNGATIVFENTRIANISIDEETDLTSQALPSYEMTVECLDVDEIYQPDTEYWKKQFKGGNPCFLKVGFEIGEGVEYVPTFYGKLTKEPDYSAGKLTFSVSVPWEGAEWVREFWSLVNRDLNTGDLVDDRTFENYIWTTDLFDDYSDAFLDQDDIDNSVCNYYGEVDSDQVRQLVANALGCFITAGANNTVDLHSANNLQYRGVNDYVTRYEQVQNTLESQPKVGKIVISRNENTLSANSFQQEVAERAYVRPDEVTFIEYRVPFYAIGKFVVNDYQKSVPTAAIQADYGQIDEEIGEDGYAVVQIGFTTTQNTYIKPIVTFYGVDNKKFDETEYTESESGENYENDNMLITNSYVASKANRVAHLVNDTNYKYEVDLMPDYRYELGDIVRLETETNKFKTCVITGKQYVMPGSSGHITCRKIFNIADDEQAILDAVGTHVGAGTTGNFKSIGVVETNGSPCIFAITFDRVNSMTYWVVLGGTEYETWIENGAHTPLAPNLTVTDKHGHVWEFGYIGVSLAGGASIRNRYLFEYQSDEYAQLDNALAWTAITLIKTLYENQGMTAPVDYECEYTIT